jgi:hypothetical protein
MAEEKYTLQDFVEWAKMCGHYQIVQLLDNYIKYVDHWSDMKNQVAEKLHHVEE